MSENNYGALMMKSTVGVSDDINAILSPGIYLIPSANTSSPDSLGGVLTIHSGSPIRRTFISDSIICLTSTRNGNTWTAWRGPLSRTNPFADIKADGAAAIAEALSNLGLDRFVQTKGNPNMRLILDDASWYVYDSVLKKNIALALNMGGTGATDAAGARANLELGNSATKNTGKTSGTVAAGDDSRITGALQKTGGDVTGPLRRVGSYPSILLTDSTMDDATIGKTVGIEQSKGQLTFYLRSGDGSSSSGQVLFNMPDITGSKTLITKEECDVRYQQQTRLGAESRYGANDNYIAVPAGCVMTGLDVGGGPSSETFIGYRPVQVNINGSWATINQL
ncbi:pyocin knob domain-containing protein [Citrobacter freundii]|uniref:pyocin knob domain-containing protein n=1 Tax=Citrobacter freundii TaxID=546 RepID=UPI0018677CE7|nr:pyocin knob domain-containing protein [Citrobacter freundii]